MPDQPNILLITSDQQHWTTLGFLNPKIKTPNLDRLAAGGTNFNRAYCPNPTCTPTRASIITGMYPSRHGAWTLGTKLPEDTPTVGEELHKHGYATCLVGKAHFQPLASTDDCHSIECQPTLRDIEFWRSFNDKHTPWYGFDRCELARMHGDETHVGQQYAAWMEDKGLANWKDYFQPLEGDEAPFAPPLADGPGYGWRKDMHWKLPEEYHYTTWTGEMTRDEIRKQHAAGKPFFCWSSYHDPHPPYCVPEPWASMYDPADMEIGHFVEGEFDDMPLPHQMTRGDGPTVREQFHEMFGPWNHGYHDHGMDDDTLRQCMAIYYGMVSFMDDQIGKTLDTLDELGIADNTLVVFSTDHGHFLGQHGLVAKGPFHYDDVIRLPFIARYPGRIPAGQHSDAITSLVDLAPTFLDAAGIDVPIWMQGTSALETWSGGEPNRDHAIVEMHHTREKVHLRTLVTERFKFTIYRGRDWGELFDLEDDPNELKNRFNAPEYAGVKALLCQKLAEADMEREPAFTPRVAGA